MEGFIIRLCRLLSADHGGIAAAPLKKGAGFASIRPGRGDFGGGAED